MSTQLINQIEKNIKIKMKQIVEGKITPKESNIGFQFNKLKTLDEPSYDKLISEYKKILKNI